MDPPQQENKFPALFWVNHPTVSEGPLCQTMTKTPELCSPAAACQLLGQHPTAQGAGPSPQLLLRSESVRMKPRGTGAGWGEQQGFHQTFSIQGDNNQRSETFLLLAELTADLEVYQTIKSLIWSSIVFYLSDFQG